ncbi:MAG TPA: ABC transporter ATP-binding protein [Intrasporangiaceae bacterium]|nr:ABC transporter ATP-binding protein [Intrasporangiaceae bacterium]
MLLRLLRRGLPPYAGLLAAIAALQLVGVIANLYLPSLTGRIIDNGVARGDIDYIWRMGAIMLAVSFVAVIAAISVARLGAQTAAGLARDTRVRVFDRVLSFSDREVLQFGAPTLITRAGNDITQVQTVVTMLLMLVVQAPIMMIGGVIMALQEDAGLAWIMAVAVPLLAIAIGLVISRMLPWFRIMQEAVDTVNRILREQITGVRVVRAFVREQVERDRFAVANTTYTGAAISVGKLMAMAFPIVMVLFNLSSAAVLWFGAHRVDNGQVEVGALFAFMQYLIQVLMAVMMTTMAAMMVPRAEVSARRINEVLATDSTVVNPADPQPIPDEYAGVEFDSVTFSYPGAEVPVIDEVSFTARPGTTTAIIGSTGAGKTTLLSLIPRLYDVTGGVVRVGGRDVREASLEDVWSRMALVPQRPYLFSGTVASNLRYGDPDADDEALWEALRTAQADGFVSRMDGGLQARIAQGGTNVSGGQRQRLAIARALVRGADILLFDDSFSALDVATDARLRAALEARTAYTTVIVVAQRVSTIVGADQIIVLDDGRVVGIGTHEDLLQTCPTYREIAESQEAADPGGPAAAEEVLV